MKKVHLIIYLIAATIKVAGQDSINSHLTISGYAEIYYQYDFTAPTDGNRPSFIYSHNRHNEFNLNLGIVKANYSTDKARANFALGAGTYMNANYSAEPGVLKNIFEANIGVKLSKKKNIWLDAGILPSHIGFESAVSKDCWTLTRSILAENTPYFETGAKLTYTTDNGKWIISAVALNGWQRITRASNNSLMSWGAQLQYRAADKILFNYSNFFGTDKPDSSRQLRFFHNIYGIFTLNETLGLMLGFDFGMEEKISTLKGHTTWLSPVAILKYTITNKWAISGRAEYYHDKKGIIIATNSPNGFQTAGYSINIDFAPAKNLLVRLEGRTLKSKDRIFKSENRFIKNNSSITASVAASF